MMRSKKRIDDRALGLARVGRHYRARGDVVGISPRLTDIDKLHAKFSKFAYNVDEVDQQITRRQLAVDHPGWELAKVENEHSVFVNRTESK
jgi:hypothetical protein